MSDEKWFEGANIQAKERNISVDSMLIRATLYLRKQKELKK